ncbi:M48 family metallopeptidase [Candidatus Pacearchaeota archaeon]|jgi:heat shock protein HtpX|nr:M48 family metallopeptidase [Candidatus Pacearchaeota archaeon]
MVEEVHRIDFRDQISRNKTKSVFLMISVFVILVVLGWAISNAFEPGYFFMIMIFSIIFSLSYLLISYYNCDKIALASVGAKQIRREGEHKQYYDLVEGLTLASGLPMPKVYVMPSRQINAFASGRNPANSVICVTEGALEKLDKKELEGVLAHELGHIGNYDIRYMTLVAVMVGMISIISEIFLRSLWFKSGNNDNNKGNAIFMLIGILLAILAPIVVYFVQLAISRKREFSADATAVKFTRYPPGLIGALKKIKNENNPEKKINKAVAPLFFANPFKDIGSTHPAIEKRINALEKM